jgi:hypothetical protein
MCYPDHFLKEAHEHSSYHWGELHHSAVCGCFFCCETFSFNEIEDWVDRGVTALCPECGIDAVIGDASGYAVDDADFLGAMRRFWFR